MYGFVVVYHWGIMHGDVEAVGDTGFEVNFVFGREVVLGCGDEGDGV